VAAAPNIVLVTPLREQIVRLTASNAGPGSVSGGVVASLVPLNDTNLLFRVVPESGCGATVSSVPGGVVFNWSLPALGSGGSTRCDLGVVARPTAASGSTVLFFGISAPGNSDPNSFNNFAQTEVVHTALDRPNDVGLQVERVPGGILAPGTSQTLELTFSNLGSGSHDSLFALSNSYDLIGGPGLNFTGYDLQPNASTPPCVYVRDDEGPFVFFVQVAFGAAIPPGGQQQCSISIVGLPNATSTSILRLELFPIGEGVYDTNPANNVVMLAIPFQQEPIVPVPLPRWGVAGLIAVLLLSGLRRLQQHRVAHRRP
jgi:hypothetical protein